MPESDVSSCADCSIVMTTCWLRKTAAPALRMALTCASVGPFAASVPLVAISAAIGSKCVKSLTPAAVNTLVKPSALNSLVCKPLPPALISVVSGVITVEPPGALNETLISWSVKPSTPPVARNNPPVSLYRKVKAPCSPLPIGSASS